ncbi:MAG TPA: dihydropteroate synthase [Anaerolineae bacterium]|nr:dihydropteroate synthase [Anaerolineae bacterium]
MKLVIGDMTLENRRPLLMGILNVTPDSFYDGGRYRDKYDAIENALKMVDEGADIIDIGGESTHPGAEPVTVEEELHRVIPVLEAIVQNVSVPVSIDTYKADVARRAVEAGAKMINDISALRFDPHMVDVVKDTGCSVVLMHMLGKPKTMQMNPEYTNVINDIITFLKQRVGFAVSHGIPKEKIIVDPGIGFGKTLEHNLAIVRDVHRFHETGCPVLIGVSRKSMIGKITGLPVEERLWGSAALTAYCVINGVEIHRVHDVKAMRQVCDVAAAIKFL